MPQFVRTLLLLAAAAAASAVVDVAATTACDVPANTLSLSCGSACKTFEPCVLKSTAAVTSATCDSDVECFPVDRTSPSTYPTFTFLIPYDATVGDTAAAPSKSNSVLTKINKWSLPSTTTNVIIRGGSSLTTQTKGKVTKVEIADDFLVGNDQVTNVRLANMDLSTSVSKLIPNYPPLLRQIWLQNVLLTTFPTEVTAFKSLVLLQLTDNSIARVDESHEMSQLQQLYLAGNSVASFTATFPKLIHLDLANNQLAEAPATLSKHKQLGNLQMSINKITAFKFADPFPSLHTFAIHNNSLTVFDAYMPKLQSLDIAINRFTELPLAIFNHSKLTALFLIDNPQLRNVMLTNTQANFIQTLKTFTADQSIFSTDCPTSQQTQIKSFTVCITGGPIDTSIIQGTREAAAAAEAAMNGNKKPSGSSANSNGSGKNTSSSTYSDPTAAESGASSSSAVLVAVGCALGVMGVALLAAFAYWCIKKRQERKTESETNVAPATTRPESIDGVVPALWNDPDLLALRVETSTIQDVKKIGQGGFSDVWLVTYQSTRQLASKRLRDPSRAHTIEFIDEIKLVATLKHPSIVELVGAAWTGKSDLQALFEYMERGDLRTYLSDKRTIRSWTPEKLQIAIDVAEALVYVHSFNPPLVHRDLKSRNVLLSERLEAKLTDFGISRFRSMDSTMTKGVGTSKWLAPEVISGVGDYGAPADVFSFGVVLSELDTHKLPYSGAYGPDGAKLDESTRLKMVAAGKLRPSFSGSCPLQILEVAQKCLLLRPELRPSATEVAFALRSYKRNVDSCVV